MAHANEKVSNLVNYAVSEEHERPDLEICLEISDRVNGTKPEYSLIYNPVLFFL